MLLFWIICQISVAKWNWHLEGANGNTDRDRDDCKNHPHLGLIVTSFVFVKNVPKSETFEQLFFVSLKWFSFLDRSSVNSVDKVDTPRSPRSSLPWSRCWRGRRSGWCRCSPRWHSLWRSQRSKASMRRWPDSTWMSNSYKDCCLWMVFVRKGEAPDNLHFTHIGF